MKAKFEQQAEEIRQTIANLQEEQTFVSNGITSADPYLQTFLKYKNIDHLERGIVVALIKQISIYEEKRIEVEFNFADQHQRILDFIEANQPKAACCQERGRLTGGFHLLIFSGAKLCIKERGCSCCGVRERRSKPYASGSA